MTPNRDDEDHPWSKVIPLVTRNPDGSQESASTLESRFFASESKPKPPLSLGHAPYDRSGPSLSDMSVLTEKLIDEVNAYAGEWAEMDPKISTLENGTGGGGRSTWLEIAKIASERAEREDRMTFCHYFEVMASLVLAEENPKLLRSYLADLIGVSALWIRKLDKEEQDKPTSPASP